MNARDAVAAKQQRRTRAALFAGTRAVENHIAVAGNFSVTNLQFIHRDVQRTTDQQWFLFQFRIGTQVENNGILAGFQFSVKFIDRDSRHPQFAQQPSSLKVFVADVKRDQRDHQRQRAVAEIRERMEDLFQLMTEQDTTEDEAGDVEQGAQSIEEEKSPSANVRTAGHRWRERAEAGNEFRRDDAAHSVAREDVPRPAHAGISLQRDAANQFQHALAVMPPEIKPDRIREQGAERRSGDRAHAIHLSCPSQSPRRQEPRRCGKWNAHLLDENREEQNERPMPRQEVERLIHGVLLRVPLPIQFGADPRSGTG